jgi:hypothetical protein
MQVALHAQNNRDEWYIEWYIDSGCSSHMTGYKKKYHLEEE